LEIVGISKKIGDPAGDRRILEIVLYRLKSMDYHQNKILSDDTRFIIGYKLKSVAILGYKRL